MMRDILNFWTWQRQKRDKSARLPHFSKLTTSKTKQFCETSFKNGKLSAELTGSCEVLHLSRKIILANLKALRKSAPWPPNISDEHVSCTLPGTQNASLLFKCPTPVNAFKTATSPHVLLTFDKVHNPLRLPRETTSERPKVEHGVFYTFWLWNVLRATMACTFSTSKSGPTLVCFVHFDLEMCFAPQRRSQLPKVLRR